jgi:hypothetical protein
MANPMKMESATDNPILLKYANSLMARVVSFFMKKNTLRPWSHLFGTLQSFLKQRSIKDVVHLTHDFFQVNAKIGGLAG